MNNKMSSHPYEDQKFLRMIFRKYTSKGLRHSLRQVIAELKISQIQYKGITRARRFYAGDLKLIA